MEPDLTKEEYLEIKQKGELNFKLCWQYWQMRKPANYPDLDIFKFNLLFKNFLLNHQGQIFYTPTGAKQIVLEGMQEKIFDYFDSYYENGYTRN